MGAPPHLDLPAVWPHEPAFPSLRRCARRRSLPGVSNTLLFLCFAVMAGDTEPIEILLHLPLLAEDKVRRQLYCSSHFPTAYQHPCQHLLGMMSPDAGWHHLAWLTKAGVGLVYQRGHVLHCRMCHTSSSRQKQLWGAPAAYHDRCIYAVCISVFMSSRVLICTASGCTRYLTHLSNPTGDCCFGHNKRGQPAEVADPDAEDCDREAAVSSVSICSPCVRCLTHQCSHSCLMVAAPEDADH